MKLTYATDFDITNLNNWSGLGHYYGVMLKGAGFDLDYINNIQSPFHRLHLLKRFFVKRTTGALYSPRFNVQVSRQYAQIMEKKLRPGSAVLSPNTVVLANVHTKNKKVLYADATFERLMNFYPGYSRLTEECVVDGYEVDRLAIHNCDLLIYTSQWAADSAINYYHADPDKVFIAPFGANLENLPDHQTVKALIRKKSTSGALNFLFLGVDWKRKGGDKALEVVNRLNKNGIKATLHIVGIKDFLPGGPSKYVVNHGFIRKDTAKGQEKFAALLSKCHFLLLPTMADCTPVAFSEANAYGIPCITTNVGGNRCIVRENVNGRVFDLSSFTNEAAEYISKLAATPTLYEQLCLSSYDRYRSELNWTTTGKKIYKLISEL